MHLREFFSNFTTEKFSNKAKKLNVRRETIQKMLVSKFVFSYFVKKADKIFRMTLQSVIKLIKKNNNNKRRFTVITMQQSENLVVRKIRFN